MYPLLAALPSLPAAAAAMAAAALSASATCNSWLSDSTPGGGCGGRGGGGTGSGGAVSKGWDSSMIKSVPCMCDGGEQATSGGKTVLAHDGRARGESCCRCGFLPGIRTTALQRSMSN
jgi:hypothetical protein